MWDNAEEAFKELDEREFAPIASTLSALLKCLLEQGFDRTEAFTLVTNFSKLLFDMTFEDFINLKRLEEETLMDEEDEDTVVFESDMDLEDYDEDDVDSDEDDE